MLLRPPRSTRTHPRLPCTTLFRSNGVSTAFCDAAAFGLIERRAQNLVFGEFGGKFAAAAKAPWLEAPDVRKAEPGTRTTAEPVEGVEDRKSTRLNSSH